MSLPSNWKPRSDCGELSLKRGGSCDQSVCTNHFVVKLDKGIDTVDAHAHFSEVLDGGGGVIKGKFGDYTFNYEGYSARHIGNGYWEVDATYITSGGGTQPINGGDGSGAVGGAVGGGGAGGGAGGGGLPEPVGVVISVSYNSTGATQHITSGYTETKSPETAVDMKKAIGVNGDAVDGVDVVVPIFEWTEDYEVPGRNIPLTYFCSAANLTGTINEKPFRGFAKGEVLFLGLSGNSTYNPNQSLQSEISATKLSFRFAAKVKKTVTVGSLEITPVNGWDYVWVRYADAVDAGVGLKEPVAVYSNRVYQYGDFAQLNLPTG